MDTILSTFRQASRKLLRTPGATAVAIVAFAFGIGLTAAMFGILQGVFLRGLPFEASHEIVHLERNALAEGIESMEVTQHDFEDWSAEQTSFEQLIGWWDGTMNLADSDLPERYDGCWISPGFLDMLRVDPILGRSFEPADAEPGAPRVVLLSYRVWQKRYGGDRDVVDRTVRVNGETATIVGVLPEGFEFPLTQELWMPLVSRADEVARGSGDLETLEVVGRLAPGVDLDRAQAELSTLAGRLAEEYPATNEGVGAVVQPFFDEFIGQETRDMLGLMFAAVLLVLLVSCFNVANLLIGRASLRGRELALRSALGSGRLPLVGAVLAEALVLAGAGGALGLGLAHFGLRAFDAAFEAQPETPFWLDFYLDGSTFLLALGATLVATLVAGLVPAVQASRADLRDVLSDSSRGSTSFRLGKISRAMVVGQVAVSAALLVAAGLVTKSVVTAHLYEHAFAGDDVLVARLGLPESAYPDDVERAAFFDELLEEVASRPEVATAALGTTVPADTAIGAGGRNFERPGEEYETPRQMPWTRWTAITPGYFDALDVSILAGRDLSPLDRADAARVAIVNQSFAETEWPGENPIGRTVDLWMGEEAEAADPLAGVVEVVGLVPNLRFAEFDNADDQQGVYVPLAQSPERFAWVIAETRSEPTAFAEPLRRSVQALDADLPLYFVRSMDQVLAETMFITNLIGVLFAIFAAAALFLACIGLYGLMSFAVTQRTQEMGVRLAMGAVRRDLQALVVRQGLGQTILGLVFGLGIGWLLARGLSAQLYALEPGDPVAYLGVPAALIVVAVLSCLVPARRASRVDPIEALRYE